MGTYVLRQNWKWTLKNLSLVYGNALEPDIRKKLARLVFEEHFQSYMEGLRLLDITVESETMGRFREAYAKNRGIILCSVHLGSWEPGIRRIRGEGVPIVVVFRKAYNPMSDREFMKIRSSYDVEWVPEDDARAIIRALQEHKVLILMTDLDTPHGGIPAAFLGVEAMCPPGPAHLALRYHPLIVPMVSIRTGIGKASLIVEHPIDPDQFADRPGAAKEITSAVNSIFEKWIVQYPEQYNWLHPRWESRPDGSRWKLRDATELLWASPKRHDFPVSPSRVYTLLH